MLYRATHNQLVLVKSSAKARSTGKENDNPLQYSCLENLMDSMKRQKDIPSRTNTKQKCPFYHRVLEYKGRKSRETQNYTFLWP